MGTPPAIERLPTLPHCHNPQRNEQRSKKTLAPQNHQRCALVGEVELLFTVKTLVLHESDHALIVGTRVVQEEVMHQCAQPARHLVSAPMMLFTDQHMDAAIVVCDVIKRRDAVFFGPVSLEIGKRLIVKTADQRQRVRVRFKLAQIFTVLLQVAALLPERQDSGVVLPAAESFDIAFHLNRT